MRLQLGSALVAGLAVAAEASASKESVKPAGVKNVAIIGEYAVLVEVDCPESPGWGYETCA